MKKIEKETKALENEAAVEEKPKEAEKPKEEEKKEEAVTTPLIHHPMQNWSDLFFILDSLSYNIDMCDIILFIPKINPVAGLETKKVSVETSYLDTTSNTLIVSHTAAGVLENLLGNYFTWVTEGWTTDRRQKDCVFLEVLVF